MGRVTRDLADLIGALRGMIELDGFRPRDGSVNPAWEQGILSDAIYALAAADDSPGTRIVLERARARAANSHLGSAA